MIEQLIGQTLGRYRILSLIGEGGMGSVLRGYDETLQRDVAIKLLAAQFMGQPNFRERFLQEARSAARLRHPGIVQVYDFGQAPGLLYIVMEFIPGDNLQQLLKQLQGEGRQMKLVEAVHLMREVSQAVDYAHRNGVLHRDIKPANIMLSLEHSEALPYQPILTDLGLAKLAEGGIVTAVGTSMGTPAYMSPEQAMGETTSARSDVYSMGVLLFELATGQLPFPAKSITDAIRYHVHQPPPNPITVRPDIPGQLQEIILHALEKNPDRRFPDADAFSKALSDFAKTLGKAGSPTPATREKEVELFTLYQPSVLAQKEKHQAQMSAQEKAEDRLSIMMRDQTTKTIPLTRKGLAIGRGKDNDLVLDQPNVSRYHARIEHDGQRYVVVDLNSTNGVYLNDLQLLPQVREPFNPESVLHIGDTWIRLERGRTEAPGGPTFGIPASYQQARSLASEAESVSGQIAVRIDSSQLAINPGEIAPVSITILNQGGLVDHFRVSVEGIPASWVQNLPEPVHLMPGKQTTVEFTIAPPRSSESVAQSHPITIKVNSTARPEQVAVLTMTLTLGAFHSYAADMRPNRQSGIREANFTVRLQNSGNAPLQVALEAQDQQDNCVFNFDPPVASVQAGQENTVVMNVQSKIPLFDDTTRFHQITVTIRPLQTPEMVQTLHAVWEQRMPAFNLALEPTSQSSLSSTVFDIAAQNKTSEPLDLELEVKVTSPQVDFALQPRSLSLLPGQEGRARLSVSARSPLQGASAETHAFSVVARPSAAPSKSDEVTGEWSRIPPQFKISLQPHQNSSMSSGRYTIQVTNQINELLNIQLEANDAEGKCSFQLDPARVSLAPGQTHDVRLTVRSKSPLAGDASFYHYFAVRGRSAEAPAVVQQIQGEWVQAPPSFTAEIRPQDYSSRMKATYTLLIRNQSDGDLDFETSAAAKDNALQFSMEPQNARVGAGKSVSTTVNVRAVRRHKDKEPLSHRFTVTTKPTIAPGVSRQVEATWRQLPGGRSVGAFYFLGLIAWIIIIAGWYFALAMWPDVVFYGLDSLFGGFDPGILYDPELFLTATIGLIGGLATGLAIRFVEPGFSIKKIILCGLFWTLALGLGLGILPQFLDIGPWIFVIPGAVGGFLTAVLVRATGLPLSGSSALLIVAGWGLAAVPLAMGIGFLAPILFGGIGGIVMFWQIGRARAKLE